jgi:LCCL domain
MFPSPSRRPSAVVERSIVLSIVAAALLLFPCQAGAQGRKTIDDPIGKEKKKDAETQVEVRFTDQSVLKLALREDRFDFKTEYGKLSIPVADVKRIEFGMRIPEDVQRRIDAAIADLGNPQFRRREEAGAILLGLREKAYGAVVKATKHQDMEIANRADELVKKFKESVPAEMLALKDFDVVHTESSKIAGRIEAISLRANTIQFGEVQLRLADVYSLAVKGVEVVDLDLANAMPGPVSMTQHQNEIGKTFVFKVTGVNNGSLWGTDVYTTDSTLAMAAVHCGLVQPGQTGVIKVTMLPGQAVYQASTRHGVTSSGYGQYPASYRVHK